MMIIGGGSLNGKFSVSLTISRVKSYYNWKISSSADYFYFSSAPYSPGPIIRQYLLKVSYEIEKL